ncbi:hypothetical protein MSAN_02336000 [Mycena sanguinolenta]|uniref:Uncharacterized protein n=1 Tax=Mycena sanguinolenta TaxID=230812 RepID=A0A8H6X723_9AGAR|nr:hypothetical protein MSAN_02336000 [Mycena sanguinolenta]
MVQMVDQYGINPYIVVGSPFLFKGLVNATSVTPAWRNALWQIGGYSTWQFNATVPEIHIQFQIASNTIQLLRNITPSSGFLRFGDVYEPRRVLQLSRLARYREEVRSEFFARVLAMCRMELGGSARSAV